MIKFKHVLSTKIENNLGQITLNWDMVFHAETIYFPKLEPLHLLTYEFDHHIWLKPFVPSTNLS